MSKKIIYLHFHSEYSFESLTRITETVAKASKNGIEAIAITDPYFFGHVKFHSEALKNSIIPILGLEIETPDGDFIVLCENKKGYFKLINFWNEIVLSDNGVSVENIIRFFEGLEDITLLSGHSRKSIFGKSKPNFDTIEKFKKLAETGKFYIQIDLPMESSRLQRILNLSQELKIPIVGSYNTMYLNSDEKGLFEVFRKLTDKNSHESFCEFKGKKDFLKDFEDLPQVFESFGDIMSRVETFEIKSDFKFPSFSNDDKVLLRKKVFDSLARKYGLPLSKSIRSRAERELNLIFSRNLESYFLTVTEIVNIARKLGILVGPGRGSAVGSLVSYALGITSIDPLKHGLIFERFLNEGRSDLPDIDIDVQDSRRQDLLLELKKHFGEDRFLQIVTFGTYGKKLLRREFQRKLSPKERQYASANLEKLSGLPHHTSIHAAGVVISEKNMKKQIPLLKGEPGYLTQFDMEDLEKIGIIKIDVLGLKTLTTIKETLKDAQKDSEETIYENLPLDDPRVFELLSQGFTGGVFQLDSKSGRNICIKIKPQSFEDISIVLALNRPGPMTSGILESYLNGEKFFDRVEINEILNETRGMLLYQEQIMRIVSEIAGLSLVKADEFRRAIAKKEPEKMQKYKNEFIEAANVRGLSFEDATYIFDKIVNFAGYAFNKSHSVAYSLLTYITAFLKTHYTPHYLKNLLDSHLGDSEKLSIVISESKLLGYNILGVDINKSRELCSAEENGIRIGLTFVKGLGIQMARNIVEERKKFGEFKDAKDAIVRLRQFLSDSLILGLIKAGALDSFSEDRIDILKEFETIKYDAKNELRVIQSKIFGIMGEKNSEKTKLETEINSNTMEECFRKAIQEIEALGFVLSNDLRDRIHGMFGDYRPTIFELLYILDRGLCPAIALNIGKEIILTDGISFIKSKRQNIESGKVYILSFKNGKLVDILPDDSEKVKYEYFVQYEKNKELEKILYNVEESKNSEIIIPLGDYLVRIDGYRPKTIENTKVKLSLVSG